MTRHRKHRVGGRRSTSSFGSKISSFFSSAWEYITDGAEAVWDTVLGVAGTVHNDVKGLLQGTSELIKNTENSISTTINHAVDGAVTLGSNLGDDVAKTANSLSLPLVVGGVAVLGLLLMNNQK